MTERHRHSPTFTLYEQLSTVEISDVFDTIFAAAVSTKNRVVVVHCGVAQRDHSRAQNFPAT